MEENIEEGIIGRLFAAEEGEATKTTADLIDTEKGRHYVGATKRTADRIP